MQENYTPDTEQVWQTDLTREDYVNYYMAVSKIGGPLRLRNIQLFITLGLFAAMIGICGYEFAVLDTIDWLTVGFGGALLLFSLGIWWYAPRHVRRSAEKVYDETVDGGYRYDGLLRVRDDRVEKENPQGVNAIFLDGGTLFVETADFMAFMTASRRAIVLPARYLTAEAATSVRHAADKLPYRNRRFVARVKPQGEIPSTPNVVEQTTVWEQQVRYETDELLGLMRHTTTQNFMKQLPVYSVLSVMCAVMFGWDSQSIPMCMGLFLLFLGLLTIFNLVTPLRRARFAAQLTTGQARTVTVRLTDRGVWLTDPNSGCTVIPWSAVEHVINRDTFVEIIRARQSVRIPKRYITDLEAFDTLICTHWKKTNSK